MGSVAEERDLGVQVHSFPKVASQVDKVVKEPFELAISQGIQFRSWDVMFIIQDFVGVTPGVLFSVLLSCYLTMIQQFLLCQSRLIWLQPCLRMLNLI